MQNNYLSRNKVCLNSQKKITEAEIENMSSMETLPDIEDNDHAMET